MASATVLSYPAPDAAVRPSVPVRHMDFQFDPHSVDTRFYQGAELASAIFESLSIFLTFGEDLVIDTARHHRQFVKDPELKQRVTALIGQEAIHSKMHNAFNDVLAQNRYPVPLYRYLADKVFDYGFKRLPHRLQLSLMAGIEHFTAVLAEYMMEHESIFYDTQDEKQRALWMWHMLEESEHKDIAYDVYQELSGNYPLRMAGFALAAFTIMVLVPLAGSLIPIWRKPSNLFSLRYWKDARHSLTLLAGREDGVFGSSMKHLLAYLRRDFHPNDFDNAAQLTYFKEKLLHPKTGLLTPYLTREFVPALRAS
ncbi:metal-dependent hydrolase [Algiphilus sp.]|uniref:metal-dependent hydrolase n=1 Tax=Algiphilus sp. TaxID=1872431 RepID=UPI003B52F02A